jgi:beta-galactosidase
VEDRIRPLYIPPDMPFPAKRFPNVIASFPHFLHGGDYNPEQWLDRPDVLEQDRQLMPVAGCNTFSINIFGWSTLEPREGELHFEHLDRTFDRIASFGGKVILATPSGARPPWMHRKYPSTSRVNKSGQREPYHTRHNHCWTSPEYRDRVLAMNIRLAERYGKHPALVMWHISNELAGECFCDLCRSQFFAWLQRKYETVDAMNKAWWTNFWSHRYDRFDEVEPIDSCVDGLQLDWRRFTTWQLCDWVDFEAAPLRKITPNIPATTNLMGTFPHVNYQQLAKHVDVICDDQYPNFDVDSPHFIRAAGHMAFRNDFLRGLQNKPFFLMESTPSSQNWSPPAKLKRPNQHVLEMTQAIAHGADGTMYFQWRAGSGSCEKFHGAVLEHFSSPQARVFKNVQAIGERLNKILPLLGTMPDARVAMIYDYESRWAANVSAGPQLDLQKYDDVCVDHHQPFWHRGIAVDVVSPQRDLSGYSLLILPQTWIITQAFADRLRAFVERGGYLVMTHDSGVCDEFNRVHQYGWPGCGLQDVLGLTIEEVDRSKTGEPFPLRLLDPIFQMTEEVTGRDVKLLMHLKTAVPLVAYAADFMDGMAAVACNQFGQGVAYTLGTRLCAPLLDRFYSLLDINKLPALIATLPTGVIVNQRGAGDERFVIAQNYTRLSQTVTFGDATLTDLETGETFTDQFTLEPLGSRVMRKEP